MRSRSTDAVIHSKEEKKMKILGIAILVTIAVIVGASEDDSFPHAFPRKYREQDYWPSAKFPTVEKKHITLYLYTKKNRDIPVVIENLNAGQLKGCIFYNKANENLFTVHGWLGDYQAGVNTLVRKAVLDKYDVNVFAVDWSTIAFDKYGIATNGVPKVGELVGNFIVELVTLMGQTPNKSSLVGLGLGAHVAGAVGTQVKKRKSKIRYIAGLDPAGPLFSLNDLSMRLDYFDAEYIQVIHTNAGKVGYYAPMGHVNYYPNGGTFQTGCNDTDIRCQHYRAYEYFAESITKPFPARECSSYLRLLFCLCKNKPIKQMDGFKRDKTVLGVYQLITHGESPFNMGDDGARPKKERVDRSRNNKYI